LDGQPVKSRNSYAPAGILNHATEGRWRIFSGLDWKNPAKAESVGISEVLGGLAQESYSDNP
jgi:hypothetical protein